MPSKKELEARLATTVRRLDTAYSLIEGLAARLDTLETYLEAEGMTAPAKAKWIEGIEARLDTLEWRMPVNAPKPASKVGSGQTGDGRVISVNGEWSIQEVEGG